MISKLSISIFFTMLISLTVGQLMGQNSIHVNKNSDKTFEINNRKQGSLTIQLTAGDILFSDIQAQNTSFTSININNFGKTYSTGNPDLPEFVKLLAVPAGISLHLSIQNSVDTVYKLSDFGITHKIVPSVHSISKANNPDKVKYQMGTAYQINTYTGNDVVELKKAGTMRNLKLYQLVYSPVKYNAVQNTIKVSSTVTVELSWNAGSKIMDSWDFEKALSKPLTQKSAIISPQVNPAYVIVSPAKYRQTLQPFVKWQRQRGFRVIEAYIGDQIESNDNNTIKAYLKDLYENPAAGTNPPSYLLLVGDISDIPAWNGTTDTHVTDLYYAEYTGDFLPELYYGRFSVVDTNQLKSVIEKTLFVEKGTGNDYSYQNNHLLISGVDSDYAPTYGNGTLNYFLKNYSREDFGITPHYYLYQTGSPITSNNSQARQAILDDYNAGAGVAFYTAHCSTDGWTNPQFQTTDIGGLSNRDKYPLMIGNCCESLRFNLTSFGEEVVRAKDKGAVAYIGATDFTYWDEDYYWSVGFTSSIVSDPVYSETGLGSFDAWFHTHNEPVNQRAYTVGQILNAGNMAVQGSTSDLKDYYWEVYSIMGDPSLIPAKFQNERIKATYNPIVDIGQNQLELTTEPNATVTLFYRDTLLGMAQADYQGTCNLNFAPVFKAGTKMIELVVSLPDFMPLIDSLNVIPPSGPYLAVEGTLVADSLGNNNHLVDYGETADVKLQVKNYGTDKALAAKASVNIISDWIKNQSNPFSINIGDIESGGQKIANEPIEIVVSANAPNDVPIKFSGQLQYGDSLTTNFEFQLKIKAPELAVNNFTVDKNGVGNLDGVIQSDETVTLGVQLANNGFSQVSNTLLTIYSTRPDMLIAVSDSTATGGFDPAESKTFDVMVKAGSNIFDGSQVDLNYKITAGDQKQYSFMGTIPLVIGNEPGYKMAYDTVEIASGYFYDSGGPNNNYTNGENSVITFRPHDPGMGLSLEFLAFDVEPSSVGCYDKLYVYDGLNTSANQLGVFCNNGFKYIIQSQNPEGALTFKFTSDAGVTRSGWIGYITSSKKFKVTVNVSDGVNVIDSALVTVGNVTDTTLTGMALFENVLALTKKDFTITKTGYFNYTGKLDEITGDTTITVLLQRLPDVCLTFVDGNTPLKGVWVKFDDRTDTTDVNGKVNFSDVQPGSKIFIASLYGYNDTSGIIDVNTSDICYNIKMSKAKPYKVHFYIYDLNGPLQDVEVSLGDSVKTTDKDGLTDFAGLYSADYVYTLMKDGYKGISNTLSVADSNLSLNIELLHYRYSASFYVFDNGSSVSGAAVKIHNDTLETSLLGKAIFYNLLPEQAIEYEVNKDGFNTVTGNFDVIDKDVAININLTHLGLSDKGDFYLRIYPNPLRHTTELNINSNLPVEELKLFNYTGSLLINKKGLSRENTINLSGLSKGIYILQIKSGNRLYFEKLMVE